MLFALSLSAELTGIVQGVRNIVDGLCLGIVVASSNEKGFIFLFYLFCNFI